MIKVIICLTVKYTGFLKSFWARQALDLVQRYHTTLPMIET